MAGGGSWARGLQGDGFLWSLRRTGHFLWRRSKITTQGSWLSSRLTEGGQTPDGRAGWKEDWGLSRQEGMKDLEEQDKEGDRTGRQSSVSERDSPRASEEGGPERGEVSCAGENGEGCRGGAGTGRALGPGRCNRPCRRGSAPRSSAPG